MPLPPAPVDPGFSVAFPRRAWYPACQSGDLGRGPLAIELMGTPLVLFRDRTGAPRALHDRCPHRNVPLSLGRVDRQGRLECGYHGWCFDGDGTCARVPGLDAEPAAANRSVPHHEAVEADGFVWVWAEPGAPATGAPFPLPRLADEPDARRVGRTVFTCDLDCTLHAAIENALDVPHTAFLHGGIFRGRAEPRPITAVRRDLPDGVEVQYLGEPIGFGPLTFAGRSGRTFDHWDRFFLPSIAQITYAIPGWLRIVNTILHLPVAPTRTRAWFVLDVSSPVPVPLARAIVRAQGRAVLRQDATMLAAQTATTRRFGGERHTSTDLDLLGRAIWRLLRRAERAEQGDPADDTSGDETTGGETTVTIRV